MPGKQIKNIIFDLGNTLVFFDHNLFFSGIASYEKRFSTNNFKEYIIENKLMDRLATGHLTGSEFYSHLKKEFTLNVNYKKFVKMYCEIFWNNKPMEQVLKNIIKEKKINTFLLSNTDNLHFSYILNTYPHIALIKKKMLSYKVGSVKPDLEIYQYLVEKHKIVPEESILVDDIEENIISAKKLGISGHHYKEHSSFEEKLKIVTSGS